MGEPEYLPSKQRERLSAIKHSELRFWVNVLCVLAVFLAVFLAGALVLLLLE